MGNIEFKSFGKITRDNPFSVTITEKMDGTNACVVIQDGEIVAVQSRKRFITPESDNYGFAAWVESNKEELVKLGDGYHYGEWAGLGIQGNPHNLTGKKLFLFDTFRWNPDNQDKPSCCEVVPILFSGIADGSTVEEILNKLKENAEGVYTPEGIIAYWHTFRTYTKHTIKSPNGKWCK